MTDHERGAYAPPTEGPLTFDARQPVRGARPFPLSLLLSILVLAAIVAALFWFYRAGVRRSGEAPQAVGAEVGQMKTAAPAEAQPADPAAGLQIYRSEAPGGAEAAPPPPKFVPPPEAPQTREAPPPKVVVTPAAQAPAANPAPLPVTKLAPPPAPKVAEAKPAPAKPAPTPAAAKPEPAKPAASGAVSVQIGAVSSTALADKTWADAVAAAPGLAAGKGKSVEKVERDGGTLYRTAVTGFSDRAAAQAFCDKLKAAGKACFVR